MEYKNFFALLGGLALFFVWNASDERGLKCCRR